MTYGQQRARANAQHALEHYMRTLFEATGLQWDSDNGSEIAGIVDDIIVAAGGEVPR